jgi:hypothetical protein
MNCWICGDPATTGEHKTKHSDLRAVLGKPTQKRPFYYHDKNVRNHPLGSFKGNFLKSTSRLCAPCNNERTQPYDRAWEQLSQFLRIRTPPLRAGDFVRGDRVYPLRATKEMCNVHLYFTKLTGCHLVEAGVKFDQNALASSILTGTPNPYIHLKFGISRSGMSLGTSDVMADAFASDNTLAFAAWAYSLEKLVVHVMYAVGGESREGLVNAWHPRAGSNRFILADFP